MKCLKATQHHHLDKNPLNKQLWEDFATFHAIQTYSQDMDPIYPVLKEVGSHFLDESATWLVFLHVAYYHIGSALKVFSLYRHPTVPQEELLKLPCLVARRGHRDPIRLAKHLDSLCLKAAQHNGLHAWISSLIIPGDPKGSWKVVNDELMTIWGNGRWAAYKTAEMLWKCNGFELEAPDMGHANSSGPRKGLQMLYGNNLPQGNSPGEIEKLDKLSLNVVQFLANKNLEVGIETAETSLCDFYALKNGRYYPGIDIDEMQECLDKVPSDLTEWAYKARQKVIPHEYLGELNGWKEIDKSRKQVYRITGQILERSRA